MAKTTITDKPTKFRIGAFGSVGKVDRKSRVIYDFSVITVGEALGHGLWIDDVFLSQVAEFGNNSKGGRGIKSRFTHPGMSGDGLGRVLGRAKNFRVIGEKVIGDLHLHDSASETPEGDLAGYIMNLAEEDPEAFGASIVFDIDSEQQSGFMKAHQDKTGAFKSPDGRNSENYPHARLSALYAADVVDDPAANPDGFFSIDGNSELASRAEHIITYALGITDQKPDVIECGPHPERIRAFFQDYLKRHNLKVDEDNKTVEIDGDGTFWVVGKEYKELNSALTAAQEQIDRLVLLTRQNQKDIETLFKFNGGL